jgi:Bacterial type II/III secretion system short domain
MRRALMLAVMAAVSLAAQEKKPEEQQPRPVTKLFILKYADPRAVEQLLRVFGGVQPNTDMHAIAVTASPQNMAAIEEAIARLDTPAAAPKNIDLTCYLVVGSESEGGTIPKDLESVVTQLRNTFPFKNYRVLDVLNLRARTGQRVNTTSSAAVQVGGTTQPIISNLRINSVTIAPDGAAIRIDGMQAGTRVPFSTGGNNFNYQDLTMNTDLDVKEGQKVVVGRMGIGNEAIFLVLTAKLVS